MEQTDVTKDPRVIADRIIAAAREHSGAKGGVRSPLYALLWDQHETLAPHLNPPQTPNWERIAAEVAADEVLDGKGQPPKAATVQKTWAKVVRDKMRAAAGTIPPRRERRKAGGEVASPAVPHPPPTKREAAPRDPATPASPDEDDEIVPRYAGGPKQWNKGENSG